MRRLVAETRLDPAELVRPVFVREGISEPVAISAMPGVVQHTLDSLGVAAREAADAGLGGLMLFGVPSTKDAVGSGADDPDGILNVALRAVVDAVGDRIVVMADLCLDEFTDHGHCGVLTSDGRVDNDATLEGDRATYQQDPANATEALRELELDLAEGADIVMVKPAGPHLDIVAAV